ncbi:MAG: M48 family metalloprotease [Pseudomonadota bacterium]
MQARHDTSDHGIGCTRRQFIGMSALAGAGLLTGCAANPVTGQSQLMLVSEGEEIQLDRENSPHQFSADYGVTQDTRLTAYMAETGKRLAVITHRPQMPYRFEVVNAVYINAYAFPGGSIGVTRGILLKLGDEAELASLLGHELGHVNSRHTAQQMSKGTLTQAVIGGLAIAAGTQGRLYGDIAAQVGMLGAGALLATYSRANEREADALGLAYMTRAGYGADGFIGLMDMLNTMNTHKSNAIELMFATHPMSSERYETAVREVNTQYAAKKGLPRYRERYMDNIAGVRAQAPAIEAMQRGDAAMAQNTLDVAEKEYRSALKAAPEDYTALVVMAKNQIAQKKFSEAAGYTRQAAAVYPQEAQAHYLGGYAAIQTKKYEDALASLTAYDKIFPGNPQIQYLRGRAYEGMGRREAAAKDFYGFLQKVREGDEAQYAYRRLVEWGYVKQ